MRIVFSDLDDTLLATDKTVPERNIAAIAGLKEAGIPFVPCTGRPLRGISSAVVCLPGITHIVSSDGAAIYELQMDEQTRNVLSKRASEDSTLFGADELYACSELIHTASLGVERTRELFGMLEDVDCTFDVFFDGQAYSERKRWERLGEFYREPHLLNLIRTMRKPLDCTIPEMLDAFADVERVTVMVKGEESRAKVEGAIQALGLVGHRAGVFTFEICDPKATKGEAVRWLCDHLSIPVSNSVAFGDSGNDIAMLQAAGLGVAMPNGAREAKDAADRIAPLDHDHGGFGAVVEELLAAEGKVR